jgi:hypothetical protein
LSSADRTYAPDVEAFEAAILPAPRGGAYVEVPAGVVAALGGKGRVAVCATFDGIAYRGSIVSMGGSKVLGVLKEIRSTLGKAPGDRVSVTVEADLGERALTLPDDVRLALSDAGLLERFAALSFSHQREYVTWIEEAKQAATRARRVRQTIERVRN